MAPTPPPLTSCGTYTAPLTSCGTYTAPLTSRATYTAPLTSCATYTAPLTVLCLFVAACDGCEDVCGVVVFQGWSGGGSISRRATSDSSTSDALTPAIDARQLVAEHAWALLESGQLGQLHK